jgi:hypothetical protein
VRYSSAGNEASAVSLEAKKRSLNAVARVPDGSNVRDEAAQHLRAAPQFLNELCSTELFGLD